MTPEHIIRYIRELYQTEDFIPLHEPRFAGNEKQYLLNCIDSTFVSSVGSYVTRFEDMVAKYTGANFAIATVNGSAALHIALKLAGVGPGDEVITQPLTFVATCNAITYCGARPVFIDVERQSMGMSPDSLLQFLSQHTTQTEAGCINKRSGNRIAAVLPMHTFGFPCQLDRLVQICTQFQLPLIEDAAESLGSYYHGQHTGTFGLLGTLSFNGNKTITTGGGGMILTNDAALAQRARHLTTTAKVPHPYEFQHDEVGYNYRLPNLNAALGCAQMEMLPRLLASKRALALEYAAFFASSDHELVTEPDQTLANYWLNTLIVPDQSKRDLLLQQLNAAGVMSRPIWTLMTKLAMYQDCQAGDLTQALWLEQHVINLPSSARLT